MKPTLPQVIRPPEALAEWIAQVASKFDQMPARAVITVTGSGASRTGRIEVVNRNGVRAAHRFMVVLVTLNGGAVSTSHSITVTGGVRVANLIAANPDGAMVLVTDDAGVVTFTISQATAGTRTLHAVVLQCESSTVTW